MKPIKLILSVFIIILFAGAVNLYVYVGTYVFPIAPYWITQLPPNPPRPEITHGEFSFKLEYEIADKKKILEDTLICDFDGFEVIAVGGPKRRKWKEYYENKQNNELYAFRIEEREYNGDKNDKLKFNQIVLQNIDHYKVVFGIPGAEYFLAEPEYENTTETYYLQVYDISTGYYLDADQSKKVLDKYNFKIISWYCDTPIKNNYR